VIDSPSGSKGGPTDNERREDARPFVIRFQDDETFEQARDILTGLTFVATLQIRTPLAVLKHHGEFHPGPPSAAPIYCSLADGFWSYKMKPWSEFAKLELPVPEEPESSHASDIGPITPSEYLPFLKEFRGIVETNASVNEKLSQLNQLRHAPMQFEQIWIRLESAYPEFPESFFYMQLAAIPGIGRALARRLFHHGFVDVATLRAASDAQLKQVPGLGTKLTRRIREFRRN
jgi:Helix-hairpin-helix domain